MPGALKNREDRALFRTDKEKVGLAIVNNRSHCVIII